jgi:hypothetical protein
MPEEIPDKCKTPIVICGYRPGADCSQELQFRYLVKGQDGRQWLCAVDQPSWDSGGKPGQAFLVDRSCLRLLPAKYADRELWIYQPGGFPAADQS